MAFSGSIMPKLRLVHGVTKQVVDPVMVVGNGSRETRRKQNRFERFVWNFPSRSILNDSKVELYNFFRSTNASLDSFLMQDPDFPEFYNDDLINKSGTVWYLTQPGGHPVFNPVMAGLVFTVNGDVKGATFAIDSDGLPTVTIADSSPSSTIGVYGDCHLTVRLNGPLSWTITAMDKSPTGETCSPAPLIVDLGDLEIIEVFERA